MLTSVEKKAVELGKDLEVVKKELKRLQSIKCRLLKQKTRKDYEEKMTEVLKEEQLLKEVRNYIEPKKLTVTKMTAEDIKLLNYEETIRALKSIQSKKCLTQYEEDLVEYNEAVRIEEMLKEHRSQIRPVEETVVKKSDINSLVQNLEQLKKLDKDKVLEELKKLLQ